MSESAKTNPDVKTVLFLCSGNYYRSRFAEELFNHMAKTRDVAWEADSAGLALNPNNKGPISALVLERLEELGISPQHRNRFPRPAETFDLACAGLVVALSHKEHYAIMHNAFPGFVSNAIFWDVSDTDEMSAEDALAEIENQVETLIGELQNGHTGLESTG